MDWAVTYLSLGAIVGLFSGLFGIGGGTILVPVLLFLFGKQHFPVAHAMHLALGTSIATILFTSLASMRKHHQHGAVSWKVVRTITPGILLGAALGASSSAAISSRTLGIFFALFVYLAAIQILLDMRPHAARQLPGMAGMTTVGAFTGWISSLVSIGGGTIIVPFLLWCNVPLRNAIGTSAAIGFPVAVGGTLGYVVAGMDISALPGPNWGFVYLPALLWVALGSVISAPIGARTVHRMKLAWLRRLFAILLLGLATNLLLKVL